MIWAALSFDDPKKYMALSLLEWNLGEKKNILIAENFYFRIGYDFKKMNIASN
jgi:hypothetical protein